MPQPAAQGREYGFALEGNHARRYEARRETRQQEQAGELGRVQHEYLQTEERSHGRRDRREHRRVNDLACLTFFADGGLAEAGGGVEKLWG